MTDPRPVRGILRCMLTVAAIITCCALWSAMPASAENLTATDGRSTVRSIEPAGVIGAEVIGGDAALRITAGRGHEVVVLGYQDEPYLRIAPDGTAAVNARSPAGQLNRTRDGDAEAGPSSAVGEPDWVPTAGTGEVIWHDHRIHSMAAVDDGHEWTIAVLVDGQPTVVRGALQVQSPPPVLIWVLLIAALGGLAVLAGRRHPATMALMLAAVAAVIALLLATVVTLRTPEQLGRDPVPILLTLGATITCVLGAVGRGRPRLILTIASAALSAGFLATMLRNLTSAVPMPELGPAPVTRVLVCIALASMLASVLLAVIASGRPMSAPTQRSPLQPHAT